MMGWNVFLGGMGWLKGVRGWAFIDNLKMSPRRVKEVRED